MAHIFLTSCLRRIVTYGRTPSSHFILGKNHIPLTRLATTIDIAYHYFQDGIVFTPYACP